VSIVARTRSRGAPPGWSQQAVTPSERLVASAPLPVPVFTHLARSARNMGAHLISNPWLPAEAFTELYRKGVDIDVATTLLDRALSAEEIDHVLDVAVERRSAVLEALLGSSALTADQQLRAARRLRTSETAERCIELPLAPSAKEALLAKVDALVAVTYAANHHVGVDDATLAQWLEAASSSPAGTPDECALARHGEKARIGVFVRLMRSRPGVLSHLVSTGGPVAEAVTVVRDNVAAGRDRAKLDAAVTSCMGGPVDARRAWMVLDLAANPATDADAVADVVINHAQALAEWCGPGPLTAAAAALVASVSDSRREALFSVLTATATAPEARHSLSGRNGFDAGSLRRHVPRPEPVAIPGVLETEELLSSLVGGGSSWGAPPAQVGAVLAAALGDDPFTWEVLLGLCDTFVGTVREMVAVTKATVGV
jgi:hypothetical protein